MRDEATRHTLPADPLSESDVAGLFPATVALEEADPTSWEAPPHPAEAPVVARALDKRRREFAAGRACARRALERIGVRDFAVLPDEHRAPVWPDGVVGSISHCRGRCVAVVARSGPLLGVGVDVEQADPLPARLIRRICTEAERRHFAALARPGEGSPIDWPKLCFSAKESFYKAYHPLIQRFVGFQEAEIEVHPATGSFDIRLSDGVPWPSGAVAVGRFVHCGPHLVTACTLLRADA